MTTPQELLTAYQQATGYEVRMTYEREMALTKLVEAGAAPEDVQAIVKEIKRLQRMKPEVYREECLGFRSLMGDADRFEERMLRLRADKKRKVSHPQVPKVVNLGPDNITLLSDHVPEEPRRADAAQALRGMADQITKKAS